MCSTGNKAFLKILAYTGLPTLFTDNRIKQLTFEGLKSGMHLVS